MLPKSYNTTAVHVLYSGVRDQGSSYMHVQLRGGIDGFSGFAGYEHSKRGEDIFIPQHPPNFAREAALKLRYEPARRTIVGIWNNNCGPRRTALIDGLLSLVGSGIRVESYGRCRHRSPQGLTFWTSPNTRLSAANENPSNEAYVPLAVCRRSRLILAEENDLCPGYVSADLVSRPPQLEPATFDCHIFLSD